ncbi:hypothetical protein KAX97_12645 [candidate division WOR-3 bacterium]|nr:hypothetical protein [candidate division WOR-3 bacterium]
MDNLKTRIPEKYCKDLEYRFNPDNAVWNSFSNRYKLPIDCALCIAYKNDFSDCGECPFADFNCMKFLREILGTQHLIFWGRWSKRNNKRARAQLRKLNREAGKYIEWVKED